MKKEHFPMIGLAQVKRVFELVTELDYSGVSIYLDGSFMTLYEGDIAAIEATLDFYASLPLYNQVLRLIKRPITERNFNRFHIGLREIDSQDVIGVVPNCFSLERTRLDTIFPPDLPNEYKILMRTFARVNNTHALKAI